MKPPCPEAGQTGDFSGAPASLRHGHLKPSGILSPVRGDALEEVVEVVVLDVGVNELFAGSVHEADIHLPGMKTDSAVEFRGGDIILHTDLSRWSRETPG
jgi:hypothetical protein